MFVVNWMAERAGNEVQNLLFLDHLLNTARFGSGGKLLSNGCLLTWAKVVLVFWLNHYHNCKSCWWSRWRGQGFSEQGRDWIALSHIYTIVSERESVCVCNQGEDWHTLLEWCGEAYTTPCMLWVTRGIPLFKLSIWHLSWVFKVCLTKTSNLLFVLSAPRNPSRGSWLHYARDRTNPEQKDGLSTQAA